MTDESKEDENNKSKDLKEIRSDFIAKRLKKNDKDSLDVFSIFYHIISMSNDKNFVISNLSILEDIFSEENGREDKLNSFIQNLKLNEIYKEIKDTDFGDNYTVEKFLNEYGKSLLKIFSDFDQITGKKNSLNLTAIDYICNRDLMAEMWPEHSDDINRWDKAYVTYRDNELDLELDEIYVKEKFEDVEKYNNGIDPENSVEIGKDTAIITATTIGAAFPPLLIVAGILFLFRANNNELVGKATEFIGKKEKELIGSLKNKAQQKSHKELSEIITKIDSRFGRAEKLKSSLPKNWKKVVEDVDMPTVSLYDKLVRLRERREKLTECNSDLKHNLNPEVQHSPA